jgi:ATP-binding cassette subfamily C protein
LSWFKKKHVHTPTLLQLEAVECGAASLGMILAYYGRWVPLAELRRACGVSRDGSKASKIVVAARSYGLSAKGFSKDMEALKAVAFPYIVFWQFNHFVVVEGMDHEWVYLNDPACGHRKVTRDEFDRGYTGVVLVMAPGPEFMKGGKRSSLVPGIALRLRSQWTTVLFCFVAGLLLFIPNMAIPIYTSVFIDTIILDGRTSWLRPLLTLMFGTIAVLAILHVVERVYLRRLRIALTAQFSSHFFWHLLKLPMSFYAQRYAGEISYRTHANARVAEILAGQLASTLIALVTMVFYLAVLLYYNGFLTAIGVLFALINFLALRALYHRQLEANIKLAQDSGKAAAIAMTGIESMETLKASGMEGGFFAKWAGYYTKAAVAGQDMEAANLGLGVLPTFLEGLSLVLILVVGGFQVLAGGMTIGMLVAFEGLMRNFLAPVGDLLSLGGTLQQLQGDLLRLNDVLENPVARDEGGGMRDEVESPSSSPSSLMRVRLEGDVAIDGLAFGYSPLEPPLIKDFTLKIGPGQRVALVGGSGSGKSTLAKVITGLYEPTAGVVRFDSVPRGQLNPAVLANSLSFVDQDILLFEGTVRDNLTLWDRTVADEALLRACRDACIDDVVQALPGGLDAKLQEGGTNLSGGQRQRLEIARALVNNPSILVLDEATSALDAESEFLIMENIRQRGCTCVLVAHRLSTIRDCDEIILLRHGEIIERGTHDSLWKDQGHYATLIKTEEH